MSRIIKNLLTSVVFILAGGCQLSSQWDSEAPYTPDRKPEIGDILHIRSGHFVSQRELHSALTRYPLVYVGEVHDNPASHRLQLEILKAMQEARPGKLALGMEMFNNEQQAALDRWVAAELGEKAFLRDSRWFDNWGGDFELYRELLEFCRDNRIPVIGLNVPKALGRKVSMSPLDELDPETRERLPEMDMDDPYQRAMVEAIFGAHSAGSAMVESFFRRQTLWDETMAASVVDYLVQHPGYQMVVIAGGWHINYGFGIPRRVHRRLPLPYVLVGGHNLVVPEQKRSQMMDVQLPEFPMRAVDYLVYQEYEIFTPRGVKLGVGMHGRDDQPGVLITDVVNDSAAAGAGLRTGDRLLSINGVAINESFDLIYVLNSMRPGDTATIALQRGDQSIQVEVNFKSGQ